MSISQVITDFTSLAIKSGGWMEMDRLYLQNKLLAFIGENELEICQPSSPIDSSLLLLDDLLKRAIQNEVITDSPSEKERLEAQIMDLLTPPPSVVNALFAEQYAKDKEQATDYFYQLSQQNDYIKTRETAQNIIFSVKTEYGALKITINPSKPEKNPRQIALEKNTPKNNYPKCLLCMENEGYLGTALHPARTNHRIIRMNVDGESWGFQYSPYAYYNEHCIFLSEKHQPMSISQETFTRLLAIIDIFPHYFVGSNADLPIVGGSILSHDHYQGGRYEFPMAIAPIEKYFALPKFPKVVSGIVRWPMSVIRLQSKEKLDMIEAAQYITEKWRAYSDDNACIRAFSEDGTPHHTVTPIARKNQEIYELDLVLRDNHVSKEHPDGIFHPHQDVQHIKKENIGLIEVMGLAVLPPRLEKELQEVEKYLLNQENKISEYHLNWAKTIKQQHTITTSTVKSIIQVEVGKVFVRVLEDAGVYKRNPQGQEAFERFLTALA